MIKKLFDYKTIDEVSLTETQYLDCTLKINIGGYPAGSSIKVIDFDSETGHLKFYHNYDQEQPTVVWQLGLAVEGRA